MSWTRLLNHANLFDEIRNDLQLTHSEVKQMHSERDELQSRLEGREREISSLKSQLLLVRDENSSLKEERNTARTELEFVRSDVTRDDTVKDLEKERDDLRRENESLEEELVSLREEVATTKTELVSSRKELVSSQEEITSLREEVAKGKASLVMKEKELEDVKMSVEDAVKAATESLTYTLNETNGRLASKENEVHAMMSMLSAVTAEKEDLQGTVQGLNGQMSRMNRQLNMEILRGDTDRKLLEKKIAEEKDRTYFEYQKFLNCEESLRKITVESTERIRFLEDQVQVEARNAKNVRRESEEKVNLCKVLESRCNLLTREQESLSQRCSSMLEEGNRLYAEHETLKETHRVAVTDLKNEIDVLKSNDTFLLKTENDSLKTQISEQNVELKKQANIAAKHFNKSRYSRTLEKLFLNTPGWEDIVKLWKQNADGSYSPLSYAEYNSIIKEKNVSWDDTAYWSQYLSISMLRALSNRTTIVDEEQGSAMERGVTDLFVDVDRTV